MESSLSASLARGDVSYALSSRKLLSGTFSCGTTQSADSFVYFNMSDNDDGSEESYDPYLDSARRKRRHRPDPQPKYFVERQSTPATVPDTNSDDTSSDHPRPPSCNSDELPKTLEVPIRLFFTRGSESAASPSTTRQKISPELRKVQHERNYWNRHVSDCIAQYGSVHRQTAEGLMYLGSAHLRCKEYAEATSVFKSARQIFQRLYGDKHLAVAKALDRIGLASCRQSRSDETLDAAAVALNRAFSIRFEVLGARHVDTVDTLNNLAGVHLRKGDLREAKQAYYEVLTVRKAIFGEEHPSVAITSHSLANVYLKLSKPNQASRYYGRALTIYRDLQLKPENPAMRKLTRDIASLNRIVKLKTTADF